MLANSGLAFFSSNQSAVYRSGPSTRLQVGAEAAEGDEAQDRDLHQQQRLRAKAQPGRGGQAPGHDEGC